MATDPVQSYLDALIGALDRRAQEDGRLAPFVAQLRAIDTTAAQRGPFTRLDHPAMGYLAQALADASGEEPLTGAAVAAARALDWSQVFAGGGIEPMLAGGMIAAQLAGSYGRFPSDEVATGLFVLAPGITYPLHTHAAAEVYYCVSGTLQLRHGTDGAPFALAPGAHSITPSNRLHALATGREPVLLSYVWIGDLLAQNWWWSQQDDGSWRRTAWRRLPGEPWKPVQAEAVSAEVMAQAHG